MQESLKSKTVKGVAWSGIDNAAKLGVTFLVSIVLARLLSPEDYGLLGIIQIVTVVCTALVNAGFTTALIRKKDAIDDDYNTAFIVNLGMSLLLYFLVFACSPLIAEFFRRVELIPLIRVTSVGLIIGALAMVQQTRLTKRIDFKTQTKVTLMASTISGIVGISMALMKFGVWSLVAQILSAEVLRAALLWHFNKWVPRLRFSAKSFHELFGFGWKIMLSSLLDAIWKELYQVVVGRFYQAATLGQYTRAKQFSHLFSHNLMTVIQRVTYPVLSSIQDDKARMVSAYRRIIRTTMFVAAISMFALGAVSEPLLYCLIGPKWHEAATYMPLICISSSLFPLHAINLNMLQVQGRSDLFLGLEIVKKSLYIGPLLIGAFVGILPMLYTNIGMTFVVFFLNSYYSGRMIGYSSWMQLKDVAPSYLIAIGVAAPVYLLKFLPVSFWIVLPMQVVVSAIIFLILCKVTHNKEFIETKAISLEYINKLKKKK